jgi:sortase A
MRVGRCRPCPEDFRGQQPQTRQRPAAYDLPLKRFDCRASITLAARRSPGGRRTVKSVEHVKTAGQESRLKGALLLAERVTWAFGLAAVAIWVAARLASIAGVGEDLERFGALRGTGSQSPQALQTASPDLRLWDVERIQAWRTALTQPAPPPIAILRIPKIRLEVAVLPGTDDFVLNRAVGHIEGTARPGTDTNSGIAGHRDGFFRGLKDIAAGDAIELETLDGREVYRVERTWIVDPEDVSVLDPTPVRSLTLVTCHPFYFIGPAPQRFIVRAVRGEMTTPFPRR